MSQETKTATTEVAEAKTPSKTELFKEHLQKIVSQTLGVKVSKDKAWNLYKAFTYGQFEFCINDGGEDLSLSLAGVGVIKVLKTAARGKKAGLDKDGNKIEGATAMEFVPRPKFYPSSRIEQMVEQMTGAADHGLTFSGTGLYAKTTEVEEKTEVSSKPAKADKPAKTAPAAPANPEEI